MAVNLETEYMHFVEEPIPGIKSRRVWVMSKSRNTVLGEIKWFGAWRQYCFFPATCTTFNNACLSSIQLVIQQMMDERKKVNASVA